MPFEHVMLREPTARARPPNSIKLSETICQVLDRLRRAIRAEVGFQFRLDCFAFSDGTRQLHSASALAFQRKLEIGSVDDPLERDARRDCRTCIAHARACAECPHGPLRCTWNENAPSAHEKTRNWMASSQGCRWRRPQMFRVALCPRLSIMCFVSRDIRLIG